LGLVEGRAPKLFISAKVADAAGQKARYIHNRGLDDQHYQQLVVGYLRKYKQAKRTDFDELLTSKLPAVLTPEQKANKVKNLLQAMKRAQIIDCEGPRAAAVWFLSKGEKN
jgi:ATP-dependent DNA helicase RecG